MTTEALTPAAAEPAAVTGGGGEIVLPQVIVDAGPGGRWGNSWGGARREASGSATSPRSTWPPTSGRTPGRSRL